MGRSETLDTDEVAELMTKVANGDKEAFDRFYDIFLPVVRRFFSICGGDHMSADDFVQEVFVRFWQHHKDFQGKSCLATYLFAIARNTLNEHRRQSRKIVQLPLMTPMREAAHLHSGLSDPEAELYLKELAVAVERARGRLTAKERHALEVSQVTDVTSQKVISRSGCSREALRSRLKRARKRFLGELTSVLTGAGSSMQRANSLRTKRTTTSS